MKKHIAAVDKKTYINYCYRSGSFSFPFSAFWQLFFLVLLPISCSAQANVLQRISAATRSDGKGYVIRFHLDAAADSFQVSQPGPQLIQVALYGQHIDTTSIKRHQSTPAFKALHFYELHEGVGIDIQLPKNHYFKAKAYPDAKSHDLLLALTQTNKQKLLAATKNKKAVFWSKKSLPRQHHYIDDPAGNGSTGKAHSTGYVDKTYQEIKKKMKFDVVVLDPGHGGRDTGAIGYHHVYEKNITLAIAKKVGKYIHKNLPGVKVVYTRKTDKFIPLKKRGEIANKAEGDLFISIHCNASKYPQVHGTAVYFLGLERSKTALKVMERENSVINLEKSPAQKKLSQQKLIIYELANSGYISNSEKFASMLTHQFGKRAERHTRGVKQARFVVLYHASMPAVLIETGFITNPKEEHFLNSNYGQNIIASAIFRAIRNYKNEFDKSQHFKTDLPTAQNKSK